MRFKSTPGGLALFAFASALPGLANENGPGDAATTPTTPDATPPATTLALEPPQEANDFRVFWKEGVNFESQDKQFKVKVGGRIMSDWGWFTGDDLESATGVSLDDGTEFRRARLYMQADMYENVKFKAEYDFAGGDADFKDVYIEYKDFPLGKWRVGHFKEPAGLEQMTSSRFITFMERSLATDAFTPERNHGLMIHDTADEGNMTWAVGVFRDSDDFGFDTGEGDYAYTGRITWLPVYDDEGESLVHVGASYTYRGEDDGGDSFDASEAHIPDELVETASFDSDSTNTVGLEAAWVNGPLSFQGEYFLSMVDSSVADDPDLSGFYVEGSYWLTGEHRRYKSSSAAFSRVKPGENYSRENGGSGAWQLALRYSMVDFDDGMIVPAGTDLTGDAIPDVFRGLTQDNITAGVNWHLNPQTRIMFNYTHAEVDEIGVAGGGDTDDDADFFMIRFQVDF